MMDYCSERAMGGVGEIIVEDSCIDNKESRGGLSPLFVMESFANVDG